MVIASETLQMPIEVGHIFIDFPRYRIFVEDANHEYDNLMVNLRGKYFLYLGIERLW